jgi:uncharacterized protein (DUF2126 family)
MAGTFAWSVNAMVAEQDAADAVAPVTMAAVFAVVLALVAAALWALVPGVRAFGATGVACLSASVALLATAPVDFSYDDGCNDHDTSAPLVVVPSLVALRPERAWAYVDFSTLMACPGDGAVGLPALR